MNITYQIKLVEPITQKVVKASVQAKTELEALAMLIVKMPDTKISFQHDGKRIIVDDYNYNTDAYTIKSISSMYLN